MLLVLVLACGLFVFTRAEERFKTDDTCVDKFCPPGTYCETRYIVQCANPPCRPLLVCTPDSANGCNSHPGCPAGQICVERTVPCIGRSCKKVAKCATIGTCAALVCPPSHKCVTESGTPTCVKTIMSSLDILDMLKETRE